MHLDYVVINVFVNNVMTLKLILIYLNVLFVEDKENNSINMTVIYITENNCKCYAVTFQNNGFVQVQQFEDVSESDKNIIYCINPMKTFLDKSQRWNMTALSGSFNKSCFDGNTILLKVGIQNGKINYVYIGGDMICSFMTNDNIYEYISNMGNNLTPYNFAIGEENYYL